MVFGSVCCVDLGAASVSSLSSADGVCSAVRGTAMYEPVWCFEFGILAMVMDARMKCVTSVGVRQWDREVWSAMVHLLCSIMSV